jgi:hypothetical protein
MDAVPLEKGPRVAVYAPPSARPWDDAVTMALQYAGIPFDRVWDAEVRGGGLTGYDWLHLHHEDFTGQYSKFYLSFAGQAWLTEMVREQSATARRLGYASVPALKKAVAVAIRDYVADGGFLFAMCTATETIDLALASPGVDIAAAFADGTAVDEDADARLDWSGTFACTGARLEPHPAGRRSPTSTGTRSTCRAAASRSARSRCSTSAPRSIRCRRCWCRTTAR